MCADCDIIKDRAAAGVVDHDTVRMVIAAFEANLLELDSHLEAASTPAAWVEFLEEFSVEFAGMAHAMAVNAHNIGRLAAALRAAIAKSN